MKQKLIWMIAVISVNIGIDQWTKYLAKVNLKNIPGESYFNDIFRIVYAENNGAFLSMGSDLSDDWRFLILSVLPIIILIVFLLYTLFSKEVDLKNAIAFSFILGGGLSNIIDRIAYGSVIDFMNMGIGSLRTGIFNVADLSIIAGVVLYFIFSIKDEAKKKSKKSNENSALNTEL